MMFVLDPPSIRMSSQGWAALDINRNCLYNDDCVCESHYINYCYDLKLQGV